MIKVSRIKLGVWRSRINHFLDSCAGEIPDAFAISLEITMNEIDAVIRHEQWDSHKVEIKQGNVVRL